MSCKFQITEVNKSTWQEFILKSEESSIFSDYSINQIVNDENIFYIINKGDQEVAGCSYNLNKSRSEIVLNDFIIHSGLIYSLPKDLKKTKINAFKYEINEFLIQFLTSKFEKISFQSTTYEIDARPWLWHNYNELKGKFKLDLRYTSYLDISLELDKLKSNFNSLRKRNIKEGINSGSKVEKSEDVNLISDLYSKMMEKYGEDQSLSKIERLTELAKYLLKSKKGDLFVLKDERGKVQYAVLIAYFKNKAYYLFGAGLRDEKKNYLASYTFWEVFDHIKTQGIDIFDFEGINSPNRGAFKLSFGGEIKPYFKFSYDKNR